MKKSIVCIAAITLALITFTSCSDDDQTDSDSGFTPDKSAPPPDSSSLLDGYTLYPCNNPGKTCNAHDPCALNPICGNDKLCRPEGLQDCSDGLDCTTDRCLGLGSCENKPKKGFCRLAVKVYGNTTCADLKKNKDAGASADASHSFMAAGDGSGGDKGAAKDSSGLDKSTGPLDAGSPDLVAPKTLVCCFSDGDRSPTDQCSVCDNDSTDDAGSSSTKGTTWTPANGGYCSDGNACTKNDYCQAGTCKGTSYLSLCSDGYSCTTDVCDGKGGCLGNKMKSGFCLINASCYKSGAMHPSGSCKICDPTKNTADWTSVSNTCLIGGKCFAKGAKNPIGCGKCDPLSSTSKWTVKGTTCCLIKGVNVKSGAMDSTKCSTCNPAKDAYGWTPITGKCFISGSCHAKGSMHPGGCAQCQPAVSGTSWTVTDATKCIVASKCVSNLTNVLACGKCGVACASGETCAGGKCSCGTLTGTKGGGPACPSGKSCSSGKCVTLPADTYAAPVTLNFEATKGKLTGTKDWEWGKLGPWKGSGSKNCAGSTITTYPKKGNSGTGVWGTKLNDCYSPLGNEGTACTNPSLKNDSVLTMKVKIPGTWKSAKLQFYQWYDVNLYFDWTEIRVDGKVVGQTCTGSKPTSPTWKKRSVNLSKYAGKIITIKFIFMASTVVQYSGWYLDDLSITGS